MLRPPEAVRPKVTYFFSPCPSKAQTSIMSEGFNSFKPGTAIFHSSIFVETVAPNKTPSAEEVGIEFDAVRDDPIAFETVRGPSFPLCALPVSATTLPPSPFSTRLFWSFTGPCLAKYAFSKQTQKPTPTTMIKMIKKIRFITIGILASQKRFATKNIGPPWKSMPCSLLEHYASSQPQRP